jgi:signal transduction histidine kinase
VRRGHGTVGMAERAAAAGGTIEIGPTAGGQFHVQVTLPIEQAEP